MTNDSSKIFDRVRGVTLKATPEEKVRQGVISWLESLGVPPCRIGREVKMNVSGRVLRADIVSYSKTGQPLLVVECKSPTVKIDQKVLLQVFQYNRELACSFVMITNGTESFIFKKGSGGFSAISDKSEFIPFLLD